MITLKKIYTQSLMLLFAAAFLTGSCKKDSPGTGLESPRLFKPGDLSIITGQTSAILTWKAPLLSAAQALTYTVEFSQDSAFASSELSIQADTTGLTVSDDSLQVRKKYFARVKANAYGDQPGSKWVVSSGFTIIGEQLFFPLRDLEVKETAVTLRWKPDPLVTKITLMREGAAAAEHLLSPGEIVSGVKVITSLAPATKYYAELFSATRSKGLLTIVTRPQTVYNVILQPGDDLAAALASAANDAVIGLNPGVYNTANAGFTLLQKTVTLRSVSGDPSDTKVIFKEFTLRGTGAGLQVSGLELDGSPANASYFINLTGVSADAEQAVFSKVSIDNCILHGAATSVLRANRGANDGDYKMSSIEVNNSLIYDVATNLSYMCFHLDKLEFGSLLLSKSTFNNFGQSLLACSATLSANVPNITFDYCTFNNFGAQNKYALMDANANPVRLNITNSIIANVPRPAGTVQNAAIRATAGNSFVVFTNNNIFNFSNASGVALTLPTTNITQIGNQAINLQWSADTKDFTLPASSVLRTVSSTGTAVGDPRWAY